jgi:hypothetical protein
MLINRFPVEQLRPAFVQFQKDKPKTSIQATEFTEYTEKETGFLCFAGSPKR